MQCSKSAWQNDLSGIHNKAHTTYHMPSSSHAEGGFELSVFLPGLRVTQLLTFGCGTAVVYSGILSVERAEHAAFFFFFLS